MQKNFVVCYRECVVQFRNKQVTDSQTDRCHQIGVCRSRHDAKRTSLEVATTTLRLVLFIYSFWLRSAFLARCRNWFSQFHFHFQLLKGHFTFVNLNFDLYRDVWTWLRWTIMPNIYVKSHFDRNLSSKHRHTDTQTQTRARNTHKPTPAYSNGNVRWPRIVLPASESRWVCVADSIKRHVQKVRIRWDRRTDGRQTVTLRLPLNAISVIRKTIKSEC